MSSLHTTLVGIGLLGPGLADWAGGQALLRNAAAWQNKLTEVPAPHRLPATERRRAGNVVKASIVVVDQALAMAGLDAATLAKLSESLRKRFGREVDVTTAVDASLIGGAVIDTGDIVIDGSLRTKLARLGAALAN